MFSSTCSFSPAQTGSGRADYSASLAVLCLKLPFFFEIGIIGTTSKVGVFVNGNNCMPFIRFESGPDKGNTFPLRSKRVSIGRSPENAIVIRDDTVSFFHAEISHSEKGFIIEDLGSANGIHVNRVKVVKRSLQDGDEISLGKAHLRFFVSPVTEELKDLPAKRRSSKEIIGDFASSTPLPESPQALRQAHENLRKVYEINAVISSLFDIKELAEKILDVIFPLFDADRGYFMLVDRENDELQLVATKKKQEHQEDSSDVAFSNTIARRVLETEESVITSDAPEDSRFSRKASIIGGHIRSAMCVPIRGREEKLGIIYADHRGLAGHFSEEQLQLLTMVANSAGIAIENIRLYEDNLKIKVLEAVNEEMRETNRKLMELEELKDDLINMVVHDMKNPVSNTMMGLDMITFEPDAELTEEQHEYLQMAKRNQFKLSEMITNLLEISKLESGGLQSEKSYLDLEELVNSIVERYDTLTKKEKKSVQVSVHPAAKWIVSDLRLLDRILANILSNAIKHSYPEGKIHIQVAPDAECNGVLVATRDSGEGIPKEFHEKIFEKFYQAGLRDLGRKTDTGLGLAFCKMAVEALGGTISVESEPKKGSCFTFSLPDSLPAE